MENIDESNRKPRRTRGTPSYYYRNRFAAATIGVGTLLFLAWSFTPMFRSFNEKSKALFVPTEEEIDRKLLFSFGVPRTSRYIQKTIDDEEDWKKKI